MHVQRLVRQVWGWVDKTRQDRLLQWRNGTCAWRDRDLAFRAARDGRPLELGKRLRLGRLAGALGMRGAIPAQSGGSAVVGILGAARLGGHSQCERVLLAAGRTDDGSCR